MHFCVDATVSILLTPINLHSHQQRLQKAKIQKAFNFDICSSKIKIQILMPPFTSDISNAAALLQFSTLLKTFIGLCDLLCMIQKLEKSISLGKWSSGGKLQFSGSNRFHMDLPSHFWIADNFSSFWKYFSLRAFIFRLRSLC